MQLTLGGLKAEAYNGMRVTLETVDRPTGDRICVRLPNGRTISVPYSGVDASDLDLPECAICAFPCFPGYTSRTACDHLFHTNCIFKWRGTAKNDPEAAGNRCPVCRAYQGPAGVSRWSDLPGMDLVAMALGAICQIHASQRGLPEPTAGEELAFVMRCLRGAIANRQASYAAVDAAMDGLRKSPQSPEKQRRALEALKIALVVHVFYDSSVDASYGAAISAWLTTLHIE